MVHGFLSFKIQVCHLSYISCGQESIFHKTFTNVVVHSLKFSTCKDKNFDPKTCIVYYFPSVECLVFCCWVLIRFLQKTLVLIGFEDLVFEIRIPQVRELEYEQYCLFIIFINW